MNMNAVGIDVSKSKSMVAIPHPYGELVSSPFEIKYTSGSIQSLIEHIKSIEGESRIVKKYTGRYYEPLARQLSLAGPFVTAVNPKGMKGTARFLALNLLPAEIGNVICFTHKGAIIAFVGIDPSVNELGTYEQKSVPTSKLG